MRNDSKSVARARLIATLVTACTLAEPKSVDAQQPTVRIAVATSDGIAVPFAVVSAQGRANRVADASGRVSYEVPPSDSLQLVARRIGYRPFSGWVVRSDSGDYRIVLEPLAAQLASVTITDRLDTPLARRGFYDRMERVRRGAFSARFFTPEELDQRNPSRVSQLLQGESLIRMSRDQRGRMILLGRGPQCAMTILLDGQRMTGTLEDAINNPHLHRERSNLVSVDDLVPGTSIAAVEVYGSAISAPAELQQVAGAAGCGIVAIWTGGRR